MGNEPRHAQHCESGRAALNALGVGGLVGARSCSQLVEEQGKILDVDADLSLDKGPDSRRLAEMVRKDHHLHGARWSARARKDTHDRCTVVEREKRKLERGDNLPGVDLQPRNDALARSRGRYATVGGFAGAMRCEGLKGVVTYSLEVLAADINPRFHGLRQVEKALASPGMICACASSPAAHRNRSAPTMPSPSWTPSVYFISSLVLQSRSEAWHPKSRFSADIWAVLVPSR